ncbi:DsbA family protein (plasmid) [Sphaerotilus sulfidivorans]|nr:thioredoxin domain-containing protein [Sphaerotilus sulfidivorans]NZD47526.1 thioredoxin domain-containing protein [Sphaerotilus sulfidivorans]QEN02866.1 disulfide bond formation protein DsbA [Sphaerotilus sulfidivorans]
MNTRKIAVAVVLGVIALAFLVGMNVYQRSVQQAQEEKASQQNDRLVRPHSPVFGPKAAPVTIVEFFDPACESCRYFYPIVKDILKKHPDDVRLVLRYAPFHRGSEQVVALLVAAKLQNQYQPVLEAILDAQPQWADHGMPNIGIAFKVAQQTGLDMDKAATQAQSPETQAVIRQDMQDLTSLGVTKTPTFFVNGRSLLNFGPEQLAALVAEEVAKVKK